MNTPRGQVHQVQISGGSFRDVHQVQISGTPAWLVHQVQISGATTRMVHQVHIPGSLVKPSDTNDLAGTYQVHISCVQRGLLKDRGKWPKTPLHASLSPKSRVFPVLKYVIRYRFPVRSRRFPNLAIANQVQISGDA